MGVGVQEAEQPGLATKIRVKEEEKAWVARKRSRRSLENGGADEEEQQQEEEEEAEEAGTPPKRAAKPKRAAPIDPDRCGCRVRAAQHFLRLSGQPCACSTFCCYPG